MNRGTSAGHRRGVGAGHRWSFPRRWRVAVVAVAAGALLVAGCGGGPGQGHASPSAERSAGGARSATSGGALFGGNAALAAEQGSLGRRLAIVRAFYKIGQPFPGPGIGPLMAGGSTLLVSIDTTTASYAQIAAGDHDGYLRAFLRAVDAAALRYHLGAIYISFEHEPDGPQHAQLGTPAQFVQAWDHVHQLAVTAHLNWNQGGRLHWVWILLHSAFSHGTAAQYWPGPGEVDVAGADGYNSAACKAAKPGRPSRKTARAAVTPTAIFGPALAFAHTHGGLPVFISEWGSDLAGGAQPAFIHQMQAFITSNHEIGAVMYWDSGGHNCNFSVNHNPTSIAALAAMGHSAALQGHVTPPAS